VPIEIIYPTVSNTFGYMGSSVSVGPPPSGSGGVSNLGGATSRTGEVSLSSFSKLHTWTSYKVYAAWSGGLLQRGTSTGTATTSLRYTIDGSAYTLINGASWTRTTFNGTDTIPAGSGYSNVVMGDLSLTAVYLSVYAACLRGISNITITDFHIEGPYTSVNLSSPGKKSACASS
jgi:hypothetical protein